MNIAEQARKQGVTIATIRRRIKEKEDQEKLNKARVQWNNSAGIKRKDIVSRHDLPK